ncbi:MAG: FAD-binding protein [Chitinophagaceae bacterium]
MPSVYAVAAKSTSDVVAAINFARIHNLRLVVKGGGHSYQGTSNSADSLLIWTRAMNKIIVHENFIAQRLRNKTETTACCNFRSRSYVDAGIRGSYH